MKQVIVSLFIVLFFSNLIAQPLTDTSSLKSLAKKLNEYLVSNTGDSKFNGSVLISQKGSIILQKSYGFQNAAAHLLNDSNTVFQIGSLTKQFTATVILKLQEEGMLSVQDKLSKYFPDYRYGDRITLENLLEHTSGIYNYINDIEAGDSAVVCNPVDKKLILDAFYGKPLDFKPGKKFSYDNTDYFLLGMVIEKITGKSYEQVVRERIFDPLKMTASGFNFRNIKDYRKAIGYQKIHGDTVIMAQRWDSTVTYAAGGIYSTVGDLYKWANSIKSQQLLSESSLTQMFTAHLGNYGYGFWINHYFGKKCYMHTGGLPGFNSCFMYYPDEDVNIIILQNSGTGKSVDFANMIITSTALSAIVFNKPYKNNKEAIEIALPDTVLRQYVGTYTLDKAHVTIVTLENGLLQIVTPSGAVPEKSKLYAESESLFFLKGMNMKVEFVKDKNGLVSQLVYHVNGFDEINKKTK